MPTVYEESNYRGRVKYAAQCFMRGTSSTRHFDSCFEMFDGDAVVTALVRRALKNPRLHQAIAKTFGGTFPQGWIDTASEYEAISTRRLPHLAEQLRQEAYARLPSLNGSRTQ